MVSTLRALNKRRLKDKGFFTKLADIEKNIFNEKGITKILSFLKFHFDNFISSTSLISNLDNVPSSLPAKYFIIILTIVSFPYAGNDTIIANKLVYENAQISYRVSKYLS